MNPADKLSKSDTQGIVQRAISADGHDVVVIFKAWPADFLAFDHVNLHAPAQRNF